LIDAHDAIVDMSSASATKLSLVGRLGEVTGLRSGEAITIEASAETVPVAVCRQETILKVQDVASEVRDGRGCRFLRTRFPRS